MIDPEPDARLAATLAQLAPHLATLADPWWLFGSAAMALHGARPLVIGDVDLLLSRSDAPGLLDRLGLTVAPGSKSDRFRSDVFACWRTPPLPVEILAGFHVRTGVSWEEIRPTSRLAVRLAAGTLYVPDVSELISLCHRFGRPKDLERIRLLEGLAAGRGAA